MQLNWSKNEDFERPIKIGGVGKVCTKLNHDVYTVKPLLFNGTYAVMSLESI